MLKMKTSIYDFVSKKKLDRVNKPIHKANGLPNELYVDQNYLIFERKQLFENKWVVVGVGSSLPKVGDAKPFDLLGIPYQIIVGSKSTENSFEFKEINGKTEVLPLETIKNKLLKEFNLN